MAYHWERYQHLPPGIVEISNCYKTNKAMISVSATNVWKVVVVVVVYKVQENLDCKLKTEKQFKVHMWGDNHSYLWMVGSWVIFFVLYTFFVHDILSKTHVLLL